MEITKKMYLLAKEIVKEYENRNKPKKSKKEIDTLVSFTDVRKFEVFVQWLEYRKEKRKPINVQSTFNILADDFEKESYEVCKLAVDSSIKNGYQGLFFDNFRNQRPTIGKQELTAKQKLQQSLGFKD